MRGLINLVFPEFVGGRYAWGLFLLRAVAGVALMIHGQSKIANPFTWMDKPGQASPIPDIMQAFAALGEFGGGLALVVGLLTPLAALGVVGTMLGAKFIAHANDPWINPGGSSWELASLYLLIGAVLLFTGPGKLSLDAKLFGNRDVPDGRLNRV